MPLFDVKCVKCNTVREEIFPSYPEGELIIPCFDCEKLTGHEVLLPLVAMHPDNMWSGVSTGQGYFTSKKEYLNNLRSKNLETITSRRELEDVRKNVRKTKKEKIQKAEKNIENYLTNELASVTIDVDNNHIPKEKLKYERARE